MNSFIYEPPPTPRVVFGSGSLSSLTSEIKYIGCSRAFILTTRGQAQHGERIQSDLLGELAVGLYSNATIHTPVHITEEALQLVERLAADSLVAFGGGSAIGLSKAIALRTGLPQIVIPTTYSGSEATPIVGQTANGLKTTIRDTKVLPRVIIYDPSLTLSLPLRTSVVSGLNAIAHAVEALYSPNANPLTDTLAEKGIQTLVRSLPLIHSDLLNEGARSDALLGAWICGTLASMEMGLHHKICHVLGGTFDLPHAETHAVVLPHVVAYNMPFAELALSKLTSILGLTSSSAAQGLYDLGVNLGAPRSLKQLGLHEEDIEKATELVVKSAPYPNPAPLEKDKIWRLLKDAYDGKYPI